MRTMLAVALDTVRASGRTVVVRLMVVAMLLAALVCGLVAKRFDPATPGGEPRFGTVFQSAPSSFFAEIWYQAYASAGAASDKERAALARRLQHVSELRRVKDDIRRETDLTDYERSVQVWFFICLSQIVFRVGMLFFVGVAAGYLPDLMRTGAIDAVVSKPVRRTHVYVGKLLGGLLIFWTALVSAHAVLFVTVGARPVSGT